MTVWIDEEYVPSLGVARAGGAVRIELRRPGSLNAFDTPTAKAFRDLLQRLGDDASVRSVLITGAGRAFSAGADVKTQFGDESARDVVETELREITTPTILALRRMAKPVIAAVNGAAAGLGCSLALACDLVLAAESTYFLLAFANIGLTPDGGASLLVPARVGLGRAFVLALLAERLPAREALGWGLADRVIPDADLRATAEDLALRLATGPTRAFAATKEAINRSMLGGLADALETEASLQGGLVRSADFLEGTAAFTAKRSPKFAGR
ncbi:enoyl-CoA hydratase-related protein [Phytohabitans sp. ZYX-F-186]|uniref:Enoyl-CoA hydratase-related protein n=1 Tax=Phytohabitans maris TaxID=3071409 RepID=A0ABU0ZPX6_9ACTN|nr:enoyl-CoA hydratase-related protein [Phytohabitans sp. ZYX-F-186]MDQ7909072.1 enoyl-CoA hydratase-related protein [Phytohabitans sp. ZYX-F-186]